MRRCGTFSLRGAQRGASPPESLAATSTIGAGYCRRRPLEIELKAPLFQPSLDHRVPQAGFVLRAKHYEPSAARANELAPNRAVLLRHPIPFVNIVVGYSRRTLSLPFPMEIH